MKKTIGNTTPGGDIRNQQKSARIRVSRKERLVCVSVGDEFVNLTQDEARRVCAGLMGLVGDRVAGEWS